MNKKFKIKINPLAQVFLSFVFLILSGAALLLLPFATYKGISVVDAIFTSTSAVCVTGLVILDTAKEFTLFGRLVILGLIQMGGFGIMTFSLGLYTMLGGKMSLQWRYTFEGIYSDGKKMPLKNILYYVIKYTFLFEFFFAAILFIQFCQDAPLLKAVEHSIFHSISAFCNAGFSTFSDNLVSYKGNVIVNLTICAAIITGGIGFIVINEISNLRKKKKKHKNLFNNLSIHSRIVLITTIILILSGTAAFYLLEMNGVLKGLSFLEQFLISLFQSVTSRTAGFNTIDIGLLKEATQFLIIFLMFIGGSPGSIAGGIKTSTFAILMLLIVSKFKGKDQIIIWGKAVNREDVDKSATLTLLAFLFLSLVSFIILTTSSGRQGFTFISVLFETTSAFGTVGLSTGITPNLTDLEKIIISLVMLTGRLGPLTLILALTMKQKNIHVEYPEEHVIIG